MRSISGLGMALLLGSIVGGVNASTFRPEPQQSPDPEPAKKARRVAAKMTKQRMRLRFGEDMPPLDNTMAKAEG